MYRTAECFSGGETVSPARVHHHLSFPFEFRGRVGKKGNPLEKAISRILKCAQERKMEKMWETGAAAALKMPRSGTQKNSRKKMLEAAASRKKRVYER